MPRVYGVVEHGMMLADRRRTSAYLAAIRNTVRPGSVVVDLGSGTGVFALAACETGARRVYAIEPGEIGKTAREVIAANGFASRVEFVDQLSTEATLPEPADVVVLDVRGVLPDDQIPIAFDARRFLRDNGRMIPASDTVWAAVVTTPDLFDRYIVSPTEDSRGMNLRALRERAVNRWYKCRLSSDDLLTDPQPLVTIDYAREHGTSIQAIAEWTINRPGIGYGFAIWFESVLSEGVQLSNAPGAPPLLYGQGYFAWPQPVSLPGGGRVRLDLTGRAEGDTYGWKWKTQIPISRDQASKDVCFDQSALAEAVEPLERAWDGLSEEGFVDLTILSLMAERRSLAEIASRVVNQYPQRFPHVADALSHLGSLSTRYE